MIYIFSTNERGIFMLTELQKNFPSKLKISPKENIQFDTLREYRRYGRIVSKISRENLVWKLLLNNRDGLYYDLNSLLYYFLNDFHFEVYWIANTLYDSKIKNGKLMRARNNYFRA